MEDTSGNEKKKQVEFLGKTVDCPLYRAVCFSIDLEDCEKCEHHRGVKKITAVDGVDIFDVLCGLPMSRRVTQRVREVRDGGSE